jgi:hypothetical protein
MDKHAMSVCPANRRRYTSTESPYKNRATARGRHELVVNVLGDEKNGIQCLQDERHQPLLHQVAFQVVRLGGDQRGGQQS